MRLSSGPTRPAARRLLGLAIAGVVAGLGLLGGCATSDADGDGYLQVGDVHPAVKGHFAGPASQLVGRLAVRPNGCVTVMIDDVERLPLWPDGTDVVDSEHDPGHYTIRIENGPTLTADSATGDEFVAVGTVDTS